MTSFIYCGVCYNEAAQCEHIIVTNIEKTMIKKHTFGTDKSIKTVGVNVTCRTVGCGFQISDMDNDCVGTCDKCGYDIIRSPIKLTPKTINDKIRCLYPNKRCLYPLKKCLHCKGSAIISVSKFKPCDNCIGIGGIICTVCDGHGTLSQINNIPYSSSTDSSSSSSSSSGSSSSSSSSYNSNSGKCNCDNGYSERCYYCEGGKLLLDSVSSAPCKYCRQIPNDINTLTKKLNNLPSNIGIPIITTNIINS